MTHEDLLDIIVSTLDEVKNEILSKNSSYSEEHDALSHFKTEAKEVGLTPFQVWHVFFNKHISSIKKAIKDNPDYPIEMTEGLKGRIKDAIAYLVFLKALQQEHLPKD